MKYKAGDIIDEYKLLSECGQGSYGTVFLAENQLTAGRSALKIVYKYGNKTDCELRGLRQYQIIAENTNLLQIYQVKEYDEFFYYTMDIADDLSDDPALYVPDTLANRLRKNRLDAEAVREMHRDLLENLQTLHGKGLFHRDIKPDNILFINNRARLGDIGLVTDIATTTLRGTPGFMPAEVLAGIRGYEARDDYYALGKVIYCALTAEPVNNYPSFPADCDIADKMDLIKLYNKYCSARPETSTGKRNRWSIFACAAFFLIIIIAGAFLLRNREERVTNPPVRKSAAPKIAVETPIQPPQPPSAAEFKQLQAILQEHISDPEVMQIYPQLQAIYEEKILAKCNKNLPLSKEEKLLADYFVNETALLELFDKIKPVATAQKKLPEEYSQKLSLLQRRRQELEANLIKDIKKIILL